MRSAPWLATLSLVVVPTLATSGEAMWRRYAASNLRAELEVLAGRDTCSDPDAVNSLCAPSDTMCCVKQGQDYPSCQQYLGRGWCCTGSGAVDNCYSVGDGTCTDDNSVSCDNLAKGVEKACCPQYTICDADFEASEDQSRCNMPKLYLTAAASLVALQSTSTPSSTQSSTSADSSASATSAPTSSSTPTPSPSSAHVSTNSGAAETNSADSAGSANSSDKKSSHDDSLSGGAIAGIVIGSVAGVILLGLLAFCIINRRRKRTANAAGAGVVDRSSSQDQHLGMAQYQQPQHTGQQQPSPEYYPSLSSSSPPNGNQGYYPSPPPGSDSPPMHQGYYPQQQQPMHQHDQATYSMSTAGGSVDPHHGLVSPGSPPLEGMVRGGGGRNPVELDGGEAASQARS